MTVHELCETAEKRYELVAGAGPRRKSSSFRREGGSDSSDGARKHYLDDGSVTSESADEIDHKEASISKQLSIPTKEEYAKKQETAKSLTVEHAEVLNILLTDASFAASVNIQDLLPTIELPARESKQSWVTSLCFDFFEDVALLLEPCLSLKTYNENIAGLLYHIESQLVSLDGLCPLEISGMNKELQLPSKEPLEGKARESSFTSRVVSDDIILGLFRLYAVLYSGYSQQLDHFDLLDHLNVSSRRFALFLLVFKLMPAKDVLYFVANFRS